MKRKWRHGSNSDEEGEEKAEVALKILAGAKAEKEQKRTSTLSRLAEVRVRRQKKVLARVSR